jgi:hypothetical protein
LSKIGACFKSVTEALSLSRDSRAWRYSRYGADWVLQAFRTSEGVYEGRRHGGVLEVLVSGDRIKERRRSLR